jgi:hypothetical protein
MGELLVYLVAGAFFLALEVLWVRPVGARAQSSVTGDAADGTGDWDLFSLPFLHERLDSVITEMDRIEDDDTIYGRAFRYQVCQLARTALLDDISRLARTRRPSDGHRPRVESAADVVALEADLAHSPASAWEELSV